ncbi:glycosyltransferase family 1 protein [Mucilaginibacter corticis]|uniref:Glycosyltransferase family 1 protein n=1 Tax=Mucilaginibacter corticis TaxID=2597670 RepID=A0A556M7W1_9SPHI|nr:glycosyltransferase [Mucilaginibacter corticis]TSJ35974.1 glycosyltransferase family 1 protein [Mucilaginibacter corticis]
MNILLAFLQDLTEQPHPVPGYRFWSYYMKNGIEESGMQWQEVPGVDWAAGLVPHENEPAINAWKDQSWERTLKYIKANRKRIDFFLCYLYPKQIDMVAIKEIRALGLPCVNFYCDNVREFSKPPAEFKVFDLVWVPEYEALPMYKKAGVKHIHLPMPMWVSPAYRNLPVHENGKISFIGSKDALREKLLADVIERGLPVEVRGDGWLAASGLANPEPAAGYGTKIKNQLKVLGRTGLKRFLIYHLNRFPVSPHSAVPVQNIFARPDFDGYMDLTRNSNIMLGINRVPVFNEFGQRSTVYSRLRDLEAPMLGACYLTEHTAGLKSLYEVGKEIETYSDTDELMARCLELLGSSSRRMALRKLGQEKALTFLSIPQTLGKITQVLFSGGVA